MIALKDLTPEQKLGRVLCARRFDDEDDINFTIELIKKEACGCLQIPFNSKTKDLVKMFRDAADYPLLIVNDMEKGFPLSSLPRLPLDSIAACDNSEYTKVFAAAIAKEAKEAGYSGCWSPVVDVVYCDSPCAVPRSASDTPEGVYPFVKDICEVFKSYGFQGCAKHYPGASFGYIDTHMVEGIAEETKEDLIRSNLVPYIKMMEDGILPSIMVGHQVLKNIDPDYPATLSKKVIDIIRELGFDGVLYTDSFAMMGILQKYGEENAMWRALMAGNDIILPNYRTPTRRVYQMMLDAYHDGKITDERLDEAVRRVIALEEYCSKTPENPYPLPENAEEILDNISRDCITADCMDGATSSLDPKEKMLFIVLKQMDYNENEVTQEISLGGWYSVSTVCDSIRSRFPNSEIVTMREFPDGAENEYILNMATKFDKVVMVTFTAIGAYVGTDCLTRRVEKVIEALAIPGKLKTIVHFGNPLALNHIENVPCKLYCFTSKKSQIYAFDVLSGRIPARGKHPFPNLAKVKTKF